MHGAPKCGMVVMKKRKRQGWMGSTDQEKLGSASFSRGRKGRGERGERGKGHGTRGANSLTVGIKTDQSNKAYVVES